MSNRRGEGKRLLTKKLVSGKYWLELYRRFGLARISGPLVLASGRGRDHSRNIKLTTRTFEFASNRLIWTFLKDSVVFFTATKETVGAFFLGTQGLNLASFGFRSPFQSQWKFVSPNWGVQIVYQLHNPFSCSEFVSFNKLVCLNSFPSFTVFYVDHRPEHITWLRRSLIKFWICGAQYWLRW